MTELTPSAVLNLVAAAYPSPFFTLSTTNGDVLINSYIIATMREW